ncbi:hypothetical protein [Streptomyces sp. NPDC096030]|uniref:hypothetical protein n=1 Tax=Streptomyces sp. NPDC096030 TaxID=3155423 RepID=UPI00331DA301
MKRMHKAALAGVLAAGLAASGAGAASAAGQPAVQPAAVVAEAAAEGDEVQARAFNTVTVTNETGRALTVSGISVKGGHQGTSPFTGDGLWTPATGDVLPAGGKESYGTKHNRYVYLTPEVTVEFKDSEGRSARYTTVAWYDGGSTVTKDDSTYYKVHGSNAGPGQFTMLSIRNA